MRPLLLLALVGCVDDRALFAVPVEVAGQVSDVHGLTLTEARVTLADLRLEAPTTSTVALWSPIPVAHAHPGHGSPGDVVGELLGTWEVDLLADPTPIGDLSLYAGAVQSGHLLVAGAVFVGDAAGHPFRFEVWPDDAVTAIPLDVVVRDRPERLVLTVDVAHALGAVDWQTPDDDGVLTEADGALANSVTFGLISTTTWSLTLEN